MLLLVFEVRFFFTWCFVYHVVVLEAKFTVIYVMMSSSILAPIHLDLINDLSRFLLTVYGLRCDGC